VKQGDGGPEAGSAEGQVVQVAEGSDDDVKGGHGGSIARGDPGLGASVHLVLVLPSLCRGSGHC